MDVALGLDGIFVSVRAGKGRINSLSLEVFSVAHVVVGEATYEEVGEYGRRSLELC